MKNILSCLGALVVAGIIAITVVGAAQAASATGAATLPNISIPDAGVTPAIAGATTIATASVRGVGTVRGSAASIAIAANRRR